MNLQSEADFTGSRSVRRDRRWYRYVLVVVVFYFTALVAEPLLWDPLRAAYYVHALDTPDADAAKVIIQQLHEMGPTGEEAVIDALSDREPLRRRRAVQYIYKYEVDNSERLLVPLLRDEEQMVWTAAEGALWDIWSKSGNPKADALFRQGVQLEAHQEYDEAIQIFEQAYEEEPGFFECLHQIANAYESSGRPEQAIDKYVQLLQFNPNHFRAIDRLADLYAARSEPEKAQAYLTKRLWIYPHQF